MQTAHAVCQNSSDMQVSYQPQPGMRMATCCCWAACVTNKAHQPELGVCVGGQQRLLLYCPSPLVKVFSPIVAAAPVPKPALDVLIQLLCSDVLVPGRASWRLPGTVHVSVRGNFVGLVICDEVIISLQVKCSKYSTGTSPHQSVMADGLAAMSNFTSQTVSVQCRLALYNDGGVQLCHAGKLVCCCTQTVLCTVTSGKLGEQAGLALQEGTYRVQRHQPR